MLKVYHARRTNVDCCCLFGLFHFLEGTKPSAFIQYSHADEAAKAKEALHGSRVLRGTDDKEDSPPLIVDFAKPQAPRRPRGGFRGGRGGFDRRDDRYSKIVRFRKRKHKFLKLREFVSC